MISKLGRDQVKRLFGIKYFACENHYKNLKFFIDKGEFLEKRYAAIIKELEDRGLKS